MLKCKFLLYFGDLFWFFLRYLFAIMYGCSNMFVI